MKYWQVVKNIVEKADIIIVVLDARMPELSRNRDLEEMVLRKGKALVRVFNKIDLVSKEHYNYLRHKYKDKNVFFVSGARNLGMSNLRKHLMIISKRDKIENPKIGVTGYPNIGKSAIINALAHRAKAIVSATAGTTRGVQIVKSQSLHILDSPGVFPYEDDEVKLGILAAKNPEQLKNPELVACKIIEMILESNKNALEDFYGIVIDEEAGWDSYEIMLSIGQRRKMIMKGGITDEHRTAIQIIRDWQTGKLRI